FEVSTEYPVEGRVRVRIVEDGEWTLSMRVPGWAHGATIRVGEEDAEDAAPGVISVHRAFHTGDIVELNLPMGPRFTSPDPRVDAVRKCVAVERGPEVMALESIDFDSDVAEAVTDAGSAPVERDGGLWARIGRRGEEPREVRLIPYHDWAQRGPSTMRVWLPTS